MLHSLHFAARAAHYRHLAEMAANDRTAVDLHAFSNLFLQMSFDVRAIERDSWKNEFLARHCEPHAVDKSRRWPSNLIKSFQEACAIVSHVRRITRPLQVLVLTPRD